MHAAEVTPAGGSFKQKNIIQWDVRHVGEKVSIMLLEVSPRPKGKAPFVVCRLDESHEPGEWVWGEFASLSQARGIFDTGFDVCYEILRAHFIQFCKTQVGYLQLVRLSGDATPWFFELEPLHLS